MGVSHFVTLMSSPKDSDSVKLHSWDYIANVHLEVKNAIIPGQFHGRQDNGSADIATFLLLTTENSTWRKHFTAFIFVIPFPVEHEQRRQAWGQIYFNRSD